MPIPVDQLDQEVDQEVAAAEAGREASQRGAAGGAAPGSTGAAAGAAAGGAAAGGAPGSTGAAAGAQTGNAAASGATPRSTGAAAGVAAGSAAAGAATPGGVGAAAGSAAGGAAAAAPESATTAPFSATAREVGGVATGWWDGMKKSVDALVNPKPPEPPLTSGQEAAAKLRAVQTVIANAFGAVSMLQDMLNVGFANLTAPLASLFPSMPAATITMLYVGVPHAHSHPPSLIPPAPPVPLPSLGPIMLGTCIRVLINGMPAARCGDIGLAVTCGGFFPFFQLKTGSSNTFIGGNRAGRMLDICKVCTQADERKTTDASKIMGAIGAAARGAQAALKYGGMAVSALGIAADAAEAATESDAAMQSAKAMAAAMGAAQMAADLAAQAMTKMMGKDPGIPPASMGAVTIGHPNVLIGGFPMVNIPNPVDFILDKLSRFKTKPPPADGDAAHCGTPDCD